MNLKQAIVVKSEFTVKKSSGKGGSRGGLPGNYLKNYMARNGATETCTPVKLFDHDDYLKRYMARDAATEKLLDREEVKPVIKELEGLGGVAFGRHNGRDMPSMPAESLDRISRDIQANFDAGKTVIKTVLSFDEEYLREMGIIEPDFYCKYKGHYRGNIDQMKLRLAIMNGMDKLSLEYDCLNYAGVIQVDTMHVHCHLVMFDKGQGLLYKKGPPLKNGEQPGKIPEKAIAKLRRGVDSYLDEVRPVRFMKSSIDYDRQNTAMYVRRASYRSMQKNGTGQFLLACLPRNQDLWRASSNRKEMQKANAIAREYVRACFEQPESGYWQVKEKIRKYSEYRVQNEGLSPEMLPKLIAAGEKKVENDCVNSIYGTLRTLNKSQKQVRTPMLDVMSIPVEQINGEDELSKFAYNLRSYSSRITHASKKRDEARQIVRDYEAARESGQNVTDSLPVYNFFKYEEEYQSKILSKYRHFLTFIPPAERYRDEYNELLEYRRKCIDVNNMFNDTQIRKYKSKERAEEYGLKIYNQHGGRFMTFAPDIIEHRLEKMCGTLESKYDELSYKLARDGLIIESSGPMLSREEEHLPRIRRGIKHDFKDVKALDLHHLGYDNSDDIRISRNNLNNFLQATAERATLLALARQYFEDSGQEEQIDKRLPVKDVELMQKTAAMLAPQPEPVLPSLVKKAAEKTPRSATVRLDQDLKIESVVNTALADIQETKEEELFYNPYN